jgi:hypothetical protein
MSRSKWRGHEIYYNSKRDKWFYTDGQPVQDNPNRACGHCGLPNTPEGHDACLGILPNVMNACCGHGLDNEAYIQFYDGSIIAGSELVMDDYKGPPKSVKKPKILPLLPPSSGMNWYFMQNRNDLWYLVPEDRFDEFNAYCSNCMYSLKDFVQIFDKYRCEHPMNYKIRIVE